MCVCPTLAFFFLSCARGSGSAAHTQTVFWESGREGKDEMSAAGSVGVLFPACRQTDFKMVDGKMGGRMEDAVLPWPNRAEVTTHPPGRPGPRTTTHTTPPPSLPALLCLGQGRGFQAGLSVWLAVRCRNPHPHATHARAEPRGRSACTSMYVCTCCPQRWAGLHGERDGMHAENSVFHTYLLHWSLSVLIVPCFFLGHGSREAWARSRFPPRSRPAPGNPAPRKRGFAA